MRRYILVSVLSAACGAGAVLLVAPRLSSSLESRAADPLKRDAALRDAATSEDMRVTLIDRMARHLISVYRDESPTAPSAVVASARPREVMTVEGEGSEQAAVSSGVLPPTSAAVGSSAGNAPADVTEAGLHQELSEAAASIPLGVPAIGPGPSRLAAKARLLGLPGTFAMMAKLESPEPRERAVAAQMIGQLNQPEGLPVLVETALTDEAEQVAAAASQAIALMDIPEEDVPAVTEGLVQLTEKPNGPASEINAIYTLVRLRNPVGLSRALALMQDPERPLQAKGILAANLAQLPLPELLPVIDLAVVIFAASPLPIVGAAITYYTAIGAQDRLAALATNEAVPAPLRQQALEAASRLSGAAPAQNETASAGAGEPGAP